MYLVTFYGQVYCKYSLNVNRIANVSASNSIYVSARKMKFLFELSTRINIRQTSKSIFKFMHLLRLSNEIKMTLTLGSAYRLYNNFANRQNSNLCTNCECARQSTLVDTCLCLAYSAAHETLSLYHSNVLLLTASELDRFCSFHFKRVPSNETVIGATNDSRHMKHT